MNDQKKHTKKTNRHARDCSICKEHPKTRDCLACHDFWVKKYDKMYEAQAKANGSAGGQKFRAEKALEKLAFVEGLLKRTAESRDRYADRNARLRTGIGNAIATIQTSSILFRKKTLQQVWNLLKDTEK